MARLLVRYWSLLVVVLLGLSVPVSHALAQDTCTVSHEFTFDTDAEGWQFETVGAYVYGEYISGGLSQSYHEEPTYNNNLYTYYTFPNYSDDSAIDTLNWSVTVTVTNDYGESSWLINQARALLDSSPIVTDSTGVLGSTGTTTGSATFTGVDAIGFHFSALAKDYYITAITLEATTSDGIDPFTGEACGGGGGPSGYSMPLKSDDLHPVWGMYDSLYINSLDPEWPDNESREPVYAYSDKLGVNVHAVAPGTVTAVDYDITSQCVPLDEVTPRIPLAPHSCWVVVPSVLAGTPYNQLFTILMANTALVLVRSDDDPGTIFTYFVSNPTVAIGDHVEAGCMVGETIALNNAQWNAGDVNLGASVGSDGVGADVGIGSVGINNTIRTGDSVTVVRVDTMTPEVVRLYPALTEEPDEAACAANYSGCLNGASSSLLSLTGWATSAGVSLLSGGGVSLSGSSQIYQTNNMTLDDATTYTMTVQARATTTGDGFTVVNKIRLFVGEDTLEDGITTTWQTFSIEFLGEDLSASEAYGVVNRNASDVGVEIRYICISGETGTQTPTACYFKNHHFDDGPTDWTYDGGVTFQNGQAYTYHNSVVEQSVQLWPETGGDATYNLTIAGRLIATSAYTGQSGKYLDISYRFPMSGSYTLIDEIDSVMVGAEGKNIYSGNVDLEHSYVLTIPITISEYTTGLFSIKTEVTDSDNYLKGFRIDYACLQPTTDDGSFPGQGGAGFDPPFVENCQVVAAPEDNNISSWTFYHWSNLKQFFDCRLMVKLNQMAETMDNAWKTTRLFLRWVVASNQAAGRWLSLQLIPWLNGQLANLVRGLGNTSSSVSDTVNTSANIVTDAIQAAQMISNAIKGIVNLIRSIIEQFLSFFHLLEQLTAAIVGAYNDTQAIPIPYLPQCTLGPDESVICIAIWILDNTVFAGPGAAVIPIVIVFGSAHLLIWLAADIKKLVLEQGRAI